MQTNTLRSIYMELASTTEGDTADFEVVETYKTRTQGYMVVAKMFSAYRLVFISDMWVSMEEGLVFGYSSSLSEILEATKTIADIAGAKKET